MSGTPRAAPKSAAVDPSTPNHRTFVVDPQQTGNGAARTVFSNPSSFEVTAQVIAHRVVEALLVQRKRPAVPARAFDLVTVDELNKLVAFLMHRHYAPDMARALVHLETPVKVFGDIHGQLHDLLDIFEMYGAPTGNGDIEYVNYIFLGDFVDRGQFSLEVVCLLLSLRILYDARITLVRGNHEDRQVNALYGFQQECRTRLPAPAGEELWQRINTLFEYLPIAAVVDQSILCLHGGIGGLKSLDEIARTPLPQGSVYDQTAHQRVLSEVLWSDPDDQHNPGIGPNLARGTDMFSVFGPDVINAFCAANNLDLIIRAHQAVMTGAEFYSERLVTVFSATNYVGRQGNCGAILSVTRLRPNERPVHALSRAVSKFLVTKKQVLPPAEALSPGSLERDTVTGREDGVLIAPHIAGQQEPAAAAQLEVLHYILTRYTEDLCRVIPPGMEWQQRLQAAFVEHRNPQTGLLQKDGFQRFVAQWASQAPKAEAAAMRIHRQDYWYRVFGALDLRGEGAITLADFLATIPAMDARIAHTWWPWTPEQQLPKAALARDTMMAVRLLFIFRMYAAEPARLRMDIAGFHALIADLNEFSGRKQDAAQLAVHFAGAHQTERTYEEFLHAVSQQLIRGTSSVFRLGSILGPVPTR